MLRTLLILAIAAAPAPAHAQVSGEWRGIGLQVDRQGAQSSWTISMRIDDAASRIDYPSLGCKGVLHEVRRSSGEIEFREEITTGDCIDGGRLLVRLMDGRLWWYWHDRLERADASAVLYRSDAVIG
jgi:hypothetical protein